MQVNGISETVGSKRIQVQESNSRASSPSVQETTCDSVNLDLICPPISIEDTELIDVQKADSSRLQTKLKYVLNFLELSNISINPIHMKGLTIKERCVSTAEIDAIQIEAIEGYIHANKVEIQDGKYETYFEDVLRDFKKIVQKINRVDTGMSLTDI